VDFVSKVFVVGKGITRAVCKIRGLALLLRIETLWRCGDGFFFRSTYIGKRCNSYNAPPTSRKRAADRSLQASGGASELPFRG
jgi:hypothetical protein